MKNNRDAIRILLLISILLVYGWFKYEIKDALIQTIIINIVTGCFVSIIIAYIDYKNKRDELKDYFINEVIRYYNILSNIQKYIENAKSYNKELYDSIESEISIINKHSREKLEIINFYYIIDNIRTFKFCKIISDLYELTFGVELMVLDIDLAFSKSGKKVQKLSKEKVDKFYKLIIKEKEYIDNNMQKLNKHGIKLYWLLWKKKYSILLKHK